MTESDTAPTAWLGAREFYEEIAPLLTDRAPNTPGVLIELFTVLGPSWSRIVREKLLEKMGRGPVFRPAAYLVRIAQEKLELAERSAARKRCSP